MVYWYLDIAAIGWIEIKTKTHHIARALKYSI